MLIYIKTSNVQIKFTTRWVYLPVSIYLFTKHKLELLDKNPKRYHAKCMHFAKNAISFDCYTVNLCHAISRLYMYKKINCISFQ